MSVPNGYAAARPQVLRVLKQVRGDGYCWLVDFEGTANELEAAGVATPEMLDLVPCGQRSGCYEFGDKFHVQRFGGGRLALTRIFSGDAIEGNRGKGRGWKAHGEAVMAEVDRALERMRSGGRRTAGR
jgi:hypothetical protein